MLLQVADRIPGRGVWLQAVEEAAAAKTWTVCRPRKQELVAFSVPDQEDPLAELWDAVVGGVELGDRQRVTRTSIAIDAIHRAPHQAERIIFAPQDDALDVLKNERAWQRVPQHAKERLQGTCPRIIEAERLAIRPIPGLRERLARRPADQNVSCAHSKAGPRKNAP